MTIGAGHKQIGQLLLQAGVIDDLQLRSALGHQRQWGGRLGRILVELKFIDDNTLASTLARQLGLESTRITGEGVDPKVVALVPQTVAERYWIFPLSFKDSKGGGELTVAVSDPTNLASVEDVRFHTGKRIKVVVAPESDIEGAIKRFYYGDAAAPLAVAPAGEEVFAQSQTSLSDPGAGPAEPEEELVELEPIPTDSIPAAQPPEAGDPLDDFFDGLTPPPPTGADALFDFEAPDPVAARVPETTPPAPRPATLVPGPPLPVARPLVPEAPAPIRVEASAFDSPHLSTMFEADATSVAPEPPPTVEVAPFATEEEIAIEMKSMPSGIPTQTQPVITLIPALAIAEPYPEVEDPIPDPVVEEVPPPAAPAEEAFAVDLHADAEPEASNEGAPFAALAPPLVGAALTPAPPEVDADLLPAEVPSPELAASPMVVEAAVAALSEPESPQSTGFEEPSLSIATEQPSAAGALGAAPFTEGELQILDSLEGRVATGVEPAQVIKPGQLVSALIRLMIRKGLLAEAELIEELQKR